MDFIRSLICVTSMDAEDTNSDFDDHFNQIDTCKPQNDPWSGLSDKTNAPRIVGIPTDPLRDQINSDKYLESLEKKLARIKGRTNKEAKPSEMISSLQRTKEDQLNQILAGQNQLNDREDELDYQEQSVMSAIQRRINPEGQALNPVELYPLLNNDFLAKVTETDVDNNDVSASDVANTRSDSTLGS